MSKMQKIIEYGFKHTRKEYMDDKDAAIKYLEERSIEDDEAYRNKSVVKQIKGLFSVESNINFFVFFGILRRTMRSETGMLSIASNRVNL